MEMEVVVPAPAVDFNFDSACSSPYMTAPSSPQRFGNFFFSAPTSPTRASSFYRELKDLSRATNSSPAVIPFQWEEKPGTPKRKGFDGRVEMEGQRSNNDGEDDGDGCEDFEFNFSGQLDRNSLSAEELFDGGKIRPLKPPPGYEQFSSTVSSPRSPRSPKSRVFRKKDFDPFEAAIEKSRQRVIVLKEPPKQEPKNTQSQSQRRGRERTSGSSSTSSSSSYNYVHKKSRSLSPFRVSDIMFEEEESSSPSEKTITSTTSNPKSYVSSILSAISFSKANRKWKLKDLLLFRSASEGRATYKDPLKNYALLSRKEPEDVKNSSFRSTESVGSVSSSRRRAPVSAHELHYTTNRAVSEEMKRKTFLPYKHGLLGCLGFNHGMHEISRSIGSLTRG